MNYKNGTEKQQQKYNQWRGPGGWSSPAHVPGMRGTNSRGHGRASGYRGRGGQRRGNYGYHQIEQSGEGYFHPAMLRDPWLELRDEMGWGEEYLVEEDPGESFVGKESFTESIKSMELTNLCIAQEDKQRIPTEVTE